MNERKVMQIGQVGIVVSDLEKSLKKFHEVFGIGPWDVYKYAPPEMTDTTFRGKPSEWSILAAFTWVGNVQLELIQPLKGPNIYYEHLEKKGEGLHHIKEYVTDCKEVVEDFKKKGIAVIQSGKFGFGEFYYFDTEPFLGISFEIGSSGGRKHRGPDKRYPE
jgi:catechol 2,3-dioxygenase-like lactoylglutathione lyase family enzyme